MLEAYDGDANDALQKADLSDLLNSWNDAPEHNVSSLANGTPLVDGELSSADTTLIATTLQDAGHFGGSFEGDIFQVLNGLHAGHGWEV
jgi:hypothetical protein